MKTGNLEPQQIELVARTVFGGAFLQIDSHGSIAKEQMLDTLALLAGEVYPWLPRVLPEQAGEWAGIGDLALQVLQGPDSLEGAAMHWARKWTAGLLAEVETTRLRRPAGFDDLSRLEQELLDAMLANGELLYPEDLLDMAVEHERTFRVEFSVADVIGVREDAEDRFVDSMVANERESSAGKAETLRRIARWEAMRPSNRRKAELAKVLEP